MWMGAILFTDRVISHIVFRTKRESWKLGCVLLLFRECQGFWECAVWGFLMKLAGHSWMVQSGVIPTALSDHKVSFRFVAEEMSSGFW